MRAITAPILPCADLDDSISFYEAIGFKRTYRQLRPNPAAVVQLGEIVIHLFGLPDFDPETSYGSVIIAVSDPDALYADFAAGLRERYGKLPSAGIPRILRPRKKHGTVRGFSVVDPGGNWLRVSKLGDVEETEETTTGLARVIENAARIGDAKGDDEGAIRLLENGLERFSDAPAVERVRALLYLVDLNVRSGGSRPPSNCCPRPRRSISPTTSRGGPPSTSSTLVRSSEGGATEVGSGAPAQVERLRSRYELVVETEPASCPPSHLVTPQQVGSSPPRPSPDCPL